MYYGILKQTLFLTPNNVFFHVLLDCNLFEVNISYSFGNKFITPTAFGAVDRKRDAAEFSS